MADLSALSGLIPVDEIARKLGVSPELAGSAVQQALPGLLSGLASNAASADGAASLEKALEKHASTGLAQGTPSLDQIDTEDGSKIVRHVFGDAQDDASLALAGGAKGGLVSGDLVKKVLPIIAPIVLAWLASQFFGQKGAAQSRDNGQAQAASGGGIGDLLGGVLGGGLGGSGKQGGLGGLLGGLGGLFGGR